MIIHNPILTGSLSLNGTDLSSITSSASNISSLNAATASLNTFSGSMLIFTGSANTRLGALESATSSLYSVTASFNAFSSSINAFTASQNTLNDTFTTTASFNASTASFNAFTASQNTLNTTFTTTASFNTSTASFNAFSASINTYTSSQNILNATFATTGSNTFTAAQTINSNLTVTGSITAQTLIVQTVTSSVVFSSGSNIFGNDISNTQQFTGSVNITGSLSVNGATAGTVTSIGLSSATSGVTIGSSPVTTSGTITLAIATASSSQNGLLSSTDFTTFNNKQNALTNPVTGTGTTNFLPKFTGATAIGNSQIFDNGTNVGIGTAMPRGLLDLNASRSVKVFFGTAGTIGETQSNASDYIANNLFVNDVSGVLSYTKITGDNGNAILQDFFRGITFYSGVTGADTTTGNLSNFERMRITSAGNVGIGTDTPAFKLDVSGTGRFSGNVAIGAGTQAINNDAKITLRDGVAFVGLDFQSARTTGNIGGLRFFGTSSASVAVSQMLFEVDGKLVFYNGTSGAEPRLTIASTGAATFTTTSGNGITITTNDVTTLKMTSSAGGTRNWGFATTNLAASDFGIYQSNAGGGDPISAGAAKLYFNGTGAATFSSSVTATQYLITPNGSNQLYNIVNANSTFTGTYAIQAGAGSAGFGGSLTLFGHSHATRAGFVSAGISVNSNGKFTVMTSAIGNGSDVFTVDVNGAVEMTGTIKTAAPSGGTAKPFKVGTAASVTPTSPNRTIEIEIDGTTYYLTAKTTNN